MSELIKYLLEGIVDDKPTIVVYGGGFKPVSTGHFLVAKEALNIIPNIEKFIIYVGSGVRDGITQEQSIQIWNIYKKYLSDKILISPSQSPIKSILDLSKDNPEKNIDWILGSREGREDDAADFIKRTKTISKYPNLKPTNIVTTNTYSGSKARDAIKLGKEEFFKNIPDELSEEDKEKVWNIISNINEDKIPGGLAQGKSLEDIAKKHIKGTRIGIRPMMVFINKQLEKGIKVEMEHTTDEKIAKEIAMDHLWEDPKYYDKLDKIEKSKLKENKYSDNFKKYILYISELADYICSDLNIEKPKINIITNETYTQENHSFGGYKPGRNEIDLVIKNRVCSDTCRTLAHELKHAQQDQQGLLTAESGTDGSEHENECNSYSGKIMREYNKKYPEILTLNV